MANGRSFFPEPAGLVEQVSRQFDLEGHIGQLERDRLEGGDRPVELHAGVGIFQRHFKGPLGPAQSHGPDAQPSSVQSRKHLVEAVAPVSEEVFFGHGAIVEVKQPRVGGPPHHFFLHGNGFKAFGTRWRQQTANLPFSVRPLPGDRLHHDNARHFTGGVRNENLASVDDPPAVFEFGLGLGALCVRSGIGLGKAERGKDVAAAKPRQPIPPLFLVAEIVDGADTQRVPCSDGGRLRSVHPGQFFHGDDIGDIPDIGAAVPLRNEAAEQSHIGHLACQLGGKFLFFIQFLGYGSDLVFRKFTNRMPDQVLLLGQIEVQCHGPPLQDGLNPWILSHFSAGRSLLPIRRLHRSWFRV